MAFPTARDALYGNPPAADHEPDKAVFRDYLESLETMFGAGTIKGFADAEDALPGSGNAVGDLRIVLADPAVDGGVYQWDGTEWDLVAALPTVFWDDAYAREAQAWAEGTLPGGAGTKSAREHAGDAQASAVLTAADLAQTTLDRAAAASSAAQAGVYRDQAATLAAAAGAPSGEALPTLPDAGYPADSYFRLLLGPGIQIWRNDAGTWVNTGIWGSGPEYPTLEAMLLSTDTVLGDAGDAVSARPGEYTIADPGEAAPHHVTAGGVKLFAVPLPDRYWLEDAGVVPDDEAAAAANKIALDKIRVTVGAALSVKRVSPRTQGTYWFPTQTHIAAPRMHFIGGGAIIKQQGGVQTTDWLLVTAADGYRFGEWQIDGNRAGAPSLHADSSLLLVYGIHGADFFSFDIYGSSGKGLAIASGVAGSGTTGITVTDASGSDCAKQVFLVDRSNGDVGDTIPCSDIVLDRLIVGATDHAGVAINDGALRVVLSNSLIDVQNATWDAVAVRGARDVTIAHTTGRRGRNGLQASVLDAAAIARGEVTDGLTLIGNTWEFNQFNGELLAGVRGATVKGDRCRANGQSGSGDGCTVTQVAGVRRSQDVTLAGIVATDDQAVPTQQRPIRVQASDDVRVVAPVARGNTLSQKTYYDGSVTGLEVVADGADGATKKRKSATTGSIPAGGNSTITVTFDNPFAIAPNHVSTAITAPTSGLGLVIDHVIAITANVVTLRVRNASASALTGTVFVTAEYLS